MGVQETRARRRINYHTETHLVYGAAANDKGQFGVQIWPDKTLPIGTVGEEKVYFADERQNKVVDSGPRYLILRIENKLLKLVLICAHGPHSKQHQQTSTGSGKNYERQSRRGYAHGPSQAALTPTRH